MAAATRAAPQLIGVIHLAPLSGSPRAAHDASAAAELAAADARALEAAGFDRIMIENFGDAPFFAGQVPPITVSAMTACALAVRAEAKRAALGINVLRNDVASALAIAVVTGATCVRVNVHTGARVTDQGIIQGDAAATLRARRALFADHVAIWADVDVKHAAPIAPRPIAEEAREAVERGLANAVLVTGTGTGARVALDDLRAVRAAVDAPVYVASGAREEDLAALLEHADGVIVGSALRPNGVAGRPVDPSRAARFADAFRAAAARYRG